MPDIIQESYEVLNHFLGEITNRNVKRLPEKHELLLKAVQNLAVYAYQLGVSEGQNRVRKELKQSISYLMEDVRYPQYKRSETEETK